MRYRNIHTEVNRHGQRVYYFRRGQGIRCRLPDIGNPNFAEAYKAAASGNPILHVREMPVNPITLRKQRVEKAMVSCLRAARTRANSKGLSFDLTLDWLLEVAERQAFRCLMTGIEFYATSPSKGKVNPYAPSLDRIDPRRGYTKDNVRIVTRAVNTMLLDWGVEVFEQVTNSYRYQRNKQWKSIPVLLTLESRTL